MDAVRELLKECGIEKERLMIVNMSAAMAKNLVDTIHQMVYIIRQIGPNPLNLNRQTIKEETQQ